MINIPPPHFDTIYAHVNKECGQINSIVFDSKGRFIYIIMSIHVPLVLNNKAYIRSGVFKGANKL